MEQHSRPATFDDIKALIDSLNQGGAEYLLIRSYALFAHGYHRTTTDIDLLVPANHAAGQKTKDVLGAPASCRHSDFAAPQAADKISALPEVAVQWDALYRKSPKKTVRDKDTADRIVLERALAVLETHSETPQGRSR